jgi:acetyl-CoA carboxylase biotin carboxyl carrier protein
MKQRPGPSQRRRAPRAPGAAGRAPTYDDLVRIVELLRSASQFSEFRLRSGDIEVEVRRVDGVEAGAAAGAASPVPRPAAGAHPADPVGAEVTLEPERAALRVPHAHADAEGLPPGLALVRAPMVGTFYRAPEPGAPPFVAPGSRVEPNTTVCLIEVMKLMNSIAAGCAGVVSHVLLNDAEPVEYGQALIAIDPDA